MTTRTAGIAGWVGRVLLCALLGLAGCAQITHKQSVVSNEVGPPPDTPGSKPKPRKFVIFFDGTHNDEIADTNVKRLHSLVTLQDRDDLGALYIEGVGTGVDIAGMGTGLGMAARVRLAYEFLMQHWRPRDEIYLVGFSRGAYSARVLNSLLYHAGMVKVPPSRKPDNSGYWSYSDVAVEVYGAVDAHMRPVDAKDEPQRRKLVKWILHDRGLEQGEPMPVKVLALWDTVESTGMPDYDKRMRHKMHVEQFRAVVDNARPRYGDKLCNVENAFQAHSLDDDREWIFTPLLLTRRYLFEGCDPDHPAKIRPENLREVWFAGAHSDVGGGYGDSRLSGVSLNWMIEQLRPFGVLPAGVRVRQDIHGTSHDPDSGAIGVLYHRTSRDVAGYALAAPDKYGQLQPAKKNESVWPHKMYVHKSVFDRRLAADPKSHENHQLILRGPGKPCLVVDKDNQDFAVWWRWREVPKVEGACPAGATQPLEIIEVPYEGAVK
jgi:uncharacterized protein (DUF2235 family)